MTECVLEGVLVVFGTTILDKVTYAKFGYYIPVSKIRKELNILIYILLPYTFGQKDLSKTTDIATVLTQQNKITQNISHRPIAISTKWN